TECVRNRPRRVDALGSLSMKSPAHVAQCTMRGGWVARMTCSLQGRRIMSLSMSALTLQIPDELAERLRGHEHELSEILELGLRELASGQGFAGAAGILELLAQLPSPQEILELRPSPELQTRIDALL